MHDAALRYFQAVAEEGSIRRASERVNVSASAVNRQILKLEEYFGSPLFERHADGMRVTDEGRLVLDHIRATFHDLDRLRGKISERRGTISGKVTIFTLDSLTVRFLPESLSSFMSRHPAVDIRVISVEPFAPIRAVAKGSADLGLTFHFRPPLRKGLAVLGQIQCPMHVIMTPDHELAYRSSVTLEECGGYPLIYQDDSGSMGVFFGQEMQNFKELHQPVLTVNTLALMKQLLLDGKGIAFNTRLGFMEELASGQLVAVRVEDDHLDQLRMSLIMSSERLPTVAVRAMADHLKASLGQFATEWERG